MYYTVYKVTNKMNGKVYIGTHKTGNLDDGYMGSGIYLKRAINKDGIENFHKEILFVFDNPEEMFAKEAELVNEDFLAEENTYNLRIGGFGGWDRINNSPDELSYRGKQGAEVLNKKRRDPDFERTYIKKLKQHWTEELRTQRSRDIKKDYEEGNRTPAFLGKKHTEETKRIMSEKSKERLKTPANNGSYGRFWYHNSISLEQVKCFPEDVPEGFVRGRVPKTVKLNTICAICSTDTQSVRSKLCQSCRKEKIKRKYDGRDEELKSLLQKGITVAAALREMGFTFSNTKSGVGKWAVDIRDSIKI